MYALASRLVGDNTMAVGDKDDPFGAMGANGPQGLPSGSFVADVTSTKFAPVAGKVNTFLADSYVVAVPGGPDAHNNVATETTGKLVAAVLQVG